MSTVSMFLLFFSFEKQKKKNSTSHGKVTSSTGSCLSEY